MDHSSSIHLPIEGCLGCFQVWASMSTPAKTICVQVFVNISLQLFWVNNKEMKTMFEKFASREVYKMLIALVLADVWVMTCSVVRKELFRKTPLRGISNNAARNDS